MIGILIVIAAKIVFKQTSVYHGISKSPAAKPDVVLFLR
jgi:hypothetical protein